MKVGTVVVWYNPDKSVYLNLKSYCNYSDKLYIIDNSKTDNRELLKDIDAAYVSLHDNTGIAHALNVGINMAIEDGCDWVLTMDQDSAFENNIIAIYKHYIQKKRTEDVGILCPQYHTDRHEIQHKTEYQNKKLVMQSANLINVRIYKKVGEFTEKLFIDCVDYDYCFRLRKSGYKIVECSKAVLKHKPAETKTKNLIGVKISYGQAVPLRYYYQIRNLLYLIWKYKSFRMVMVLTVKIGKIIVLFDNKGNYLKAVKQAVYDFRHNRYGRKE